jgi:hypothetical protein
MMEERRQGDLMIMDKLSAMHTDLALNTRETTRIAEYQKQTNGKVAAHETRLQAIESNQALISNNLAQINSLNAAKSSQSRDWKDWGLKGIIAIAVMLFYYLLTNNGFPNFLN